MAEVRFRCILLLPPPDCLRCKRHTVIRGTPKKFRGKLPTYCGSRNLCTPCYYWLRVNSPDDLADYPRRNRPAAEVYEDYLRLKAANGDKLNKRQIAARIGISFTAISQAIIRERRRERARQQEEVAA